MNRVSKTVCNANVKHSVLNENSKLICATCHEYMFDVVHDFCVSDYLNDVNAHVKSKFVNSRSVKSKKKKMWKPTDKVYTKLAKQGLVRGLPKLKFEKDHLCSSCSLGKSKKSSHKPKVDDTNQEKLYLLHMDLCGPMRVESINGKKYILVIVDDYSKFMWVKFLRSKDEAPETLREYYDNVGISHQTSVARTPQQNGVKQSIQLVIPKTYPSYVSVTTKLHMSLCTARNQIYLTFMSLVPSVIRPITFKTRAKSYSSTTLCTTHKNDWDILFQPMFDEFFNSPPSVVSLVPVAVALRLFDPTGVEESPKTVHFHDDPLHGESTSQETSSNVRPSNIPLELLGKWTKNHPLANVIRDPSRLVSTRNVEYK
ncbi:retrovirus-related pol polyprotein from transposon TNT 1-94 [Tanacetum coccineum]